MTKKPSISSLLYLSLSTLLLSHCASLEDECLDIIARDEQIITEQKGDYYIGRRYYVPSTRFWGYVRKPAESWSSARLVMMDESLVKQPDRGPEEPRPRATFGKDNNVEYFIHGKFSEDQCYDPNSNQVLPIFLARHYEVRDRRPGFLFTPEEEYKSESVTLFPSLAPTEAEYQSVNLKPVQF